MGFLKKLLLVGVSVTFTWTAAGAGTTVLPSPDLP